MKSRNLEVSVQRIEPSLFWSAFRSFAGNIDVEASFCEGFLVGVQRTSVPSKAGLSELVRDRGDAIATSDLVVAHVVETGDLTDTL